MLSPKICGLDHDIRSMRNFSKLQSGKLLLPSDYELYQEAKQKDDEGGGERNSYHLPFRRVAPTPKIAHAAIGLRHMCGEVT
jgi:hypothetical protein